MLSDDTTLEVLALYDMGWEPTEIDEKLNLPLGAAAQTIADDAQEFPDSPLRACLVLH
jgi:hypothetical protein